MGAKSQAAWLPTVKTTESKPLTFVGLLCKYRQHTYLLQNRSTPSSAIAGVLNPSSARIESQQKPRFPPGATYSADLRSPQPISMSPLLKRDDSTTILGGVLGGIGGLFLLLVLVYRLCLKPGSQRQRKSRHRRHWSRGHRHHRRRSHDPESGGSVHEMFPPGSPPGFGASRPCALRCMRERSSTASYAAGCKFRRCSIALYLEEP